MHIVPWRPFFPELFDEEGWGDAWHFSPALDVYDDGEYVVVEAPIAGIDPAKINIEIEDNVLKLSGTVEKKTEVDEKNYYRKEVRHGSFSRAVALPHAVDGGKAKANYKNGILKITVPKREEAKPKSVHVTIDES